MTKICACISFVIITLGIGIIVKDDIQWPVHQKEFNKYHQQQQTFDTVAVGLLLTGDVGLLLATVFA
jgi:hypothetical protein